MSSSNRYLFEIEKALRTGSLSLDRDLESEFARRRANIEGARTVAQAVTPKNRSAWRALPETFSFCKMHLRKPDPCFVG